MPEVTIADIEASEKASQQPAAAPVEAPAAEPVVSGATESEDVATEQPPVEGADGDAPVAPVVKKSQGGFQRRIDELTKQTHQERREKEQLIEIVKALTGGAAKPQEAPQAAQPEQEPVRGENEDYEAYLRRVWRWETQQEITKALTASERAANQRAQEQQVTQVAEAVTQRYAQAVDEFKKTTPDFEEVVGRDDIHIPDYAGKLIGLRADAPMIFYAIGKHPELANYLQRNEGNQHALGMAVGEIAAALRYRPQVSSAPPPGKPVGSNAATSGTKPPDDVGSYMKWREKQNFRR